MLLQEFKLAWDCHAHVFGGGALVSRPEGPKRCAGLDDYLEAVLRPLGLGGVVLVQPSALGTDHSVLLNSLRALGGRGRGVAVLDQHGGSDCLEAWHLAGIRGVRFAPRLRQGNLSVILDAAPQLKNLGWHVQVYADRLQVPDIAAALASTRLLVVFDHFARLTSDLETNDPAMRSAIELLEMGNGWVKLSGAYHLSGQPAPFEDLGRLARTLFNANPNRIVWGSDWPHPNAKFDVEEMALLRTLDVWGFDGDEQRRILIDNPLALYGLI